MRAPYLGPVVRRPMVLDAASSMFAEAGYGGSSMRAIAASMGISKAVLYDCFPGGKREILDAVLDRTERRFRRSVLVPLDPARSTEAALSMAIDGFVGFAEEDPDGFRFIFGGSGTRDRRISKRVFRARDRLIEGFDTWLRAALGRHDPCGADPELLVAMMAAIADELTGRSVAPVARADVVRAMVMVLMRTT